MLALLRAFATVTSVATLWYSFGQLVTATDSANPHVINGLRSPSELVIGERIC